MAGYDTHSRDGKFVGFLVAAVVGWFVYQSTTSLQLTGGAVAVTYATVWSGSQFPDTDIESSIPYRYATQVASLVALGAVGYIAYTNWATYLDVLDAFVGQYLPPLIPMWLVAIAVLVTVLPLTRPIAGQLISTVTGSHRTRTHSPLVLLALAGVLALALYLYLPPLPINSSYRPIVSATLPGLFALGAFVHITRDMLS